MHYFITLVNLDFKKLVPLVMMKLRNDFFVVFALDGRDGLSSCH